jgi:hypothetical protein
VTPNGKSAALLGSALLVMFALSGYGISGRTTATITAVASEARAKPVYLPSECTNQRQRPTFFFIGCRGGDTGVDKLAWHAWGDPIAQGVGFAYVNDCEPNCSTGGLHYTPAEMYVSRLRQCRGRSQYTYAVVVVAEGRAHRLTDAYEIPCDG